MKLRSVAGLRLQVHQGRVLFRGIGHYLSHREERVRKDGHSRGAVQAEPGGAGARLFDVDDDFPRVDVEDYRLRVTNGEREPAVVIRATFDLEADDLKDLGADFPALLERPQLTLSKGYRNEVVVELAASEERAVESLMRTAAAATSKSRALASVHDARGALGGARAVRAGGVGRQAPLVDRGHQGEGPGSFPVRALPGGQGAEVPVLRRVLPDGRAGQRRGPDRAQAQQPPPRFRPPAAGARRPGPDGPRGDLQPEEGAAERQPARGRVQPPDPHRDEVLVAEPLSWRCASTSGRGCPTTRPACRPAPTSGATSTTRSSG